jgi:hypothetical protein
VEATQDIIRFRELLGELGFDQIEPTNVYADHTLAKAFSGNHQRVKHFMERINFMIEQVRNNVIVLKQGPSQSNVVDILTKPVGILTFLDCGRPCLGETPRSSFLVAAFGT